MKKYTVDYTKKAIKSLKKLDRQTQTMIYEWIGKNLEGVKTHVRMAKD